MPDDQGEQMISCYHPNAMLIYKEKLDHFKPYATEIGHIAHIWNALHQKISDFFVWMLDAKQADAAMAILATLKSDRAQREACAAVAKIVLRHNPRHLEEFTWLLIQIDRLSTDRNDAVHTPFINIWPSDDPNSPMAKLVSGIIPHPTAPDQTRRRRLMDKDLLKEFITYRDEINSLLTFAGLLSPLITAALRPDEWKGWNWPWPERPLLRSTARSKKATEHRPRRAKSRRPQPQSSPK
jgi:hypothetical protein